MEIKDLIRLTEIDKEVYILTSRYKKEILNYIINKLKNIEGFKPFEINLKILKVSTTGYCYPSMYLDDLTELSLINIYYTYDYKEYEITSTFYELFKYEFYTIYRSENKKDYSCYYNNKINIEEILTEEEITKYDKKSLNDYVLGVFKYIKS